MKVARKPSRSRAFGPLVMMSLTAGLAACGGGSGDSSTPIDTPVSPAAPAASAPVAAAATVAPSIATQPADQTVVTGTSTILSVSAGGDSLSYQWQRSTDNGGTWVNVAGATSANYNLSAADASLNGSKFRVVVTNSLNTVTSSPVTVTVAASVVAAAITADVANQSVTEGSDVTFVVTATGTALTYQWQNSVDGSTWVDIVGATGSTLTLPKVALADSRKQYRVVVSNSAGKVTSSAGVLVVSEAAALPAIVTVAKAVSVKAPATATFSVTATGKPAPTYQWQKASSAGAAYADIAGATNASYTTPATTLADSGSLYRVTASNSAGNAVSDAVALTVTAADVPAAITTQPLAVTVTSPSAAVFSVVATGTPAATYQWQSSADGITYANITGATSPTYTTPATTAADNGKKYRVVVTNSAGTVTSSAVALTVNAVVASSGLVGRAWATGQLIEASNGTNPNGLATDIDDAGVATLVFARSNGTRTALYASRGTPGAAGAAPSWTPPIAIDAAGTDTYGVGATTAGNGVSNTNRYRVFAAPNGDAYAVWSTVRPCTATTYSTSGNCNYFAMARYSAATAGWDAPVIVTDTNNRSEPVVRVNAGGDVAVLYRGFERPTTGYVEKDAIAWRKRGTTAFVRATFPTAATSFGMDGNGNMAVLGEASQNSTTDYVAYRGNVTSGFGAQEIIDTRLSAANAEVDVSVGKNGQIFGFYSQNDGTSVRFYSATAPSVTAPFTVTDLNSTRPSIISGEQFAVALDSGDALLRVNCTVKRWSAAGSTWSAASTVPDGCGSFDTYAVSSIGDALKLVTASSRWATYDAATNKMVQAIPNNTSGLPTTGPQFVYGASAPLTVGNGTDAYSFALSKGGIGVVVVLTARDVLPTAALPVGDGRAAVYNLYGVFLK